MILIVRGRPAVVNNNQSLPRHSKPSAVYQKPKTRNLSGQKMLKTGLWNNNIVSFCNVSLPRETAVARPNSAPVILTKSGQERINRMCLPTGNVAFLRETER